MKTYQPKEKEVKRGWHLVDVGDQILGRISTRIATLLMGKHKATYSTHMDMGDYVVVINAGSIKVSGKKEKQKVYQSHSGFPRGFKSIEFRKLKKEQPEKIIVKAVSRMLPKNKLQAKRLKRLKVFAKDTHTFSDKFIENGSQK